MGNEDGRDGSMKDKVLRVIVVGETATGKTTLAAKIIEALQEKGFKIDSSQSDYAEYLRSPDKDRRTVALKEALIMVEEVQANRLSRRLQHGS